MADIVTEQAWLTSVDPIDLSRYGRGRIDPHRFRWLAVAWGQRIRHLLEPENLIWFDAYTAWVSGDSRHPIELDLPEFWMPLDRPIASVGSSRLFVDILKTLQDPMHAAAFASEAASDDYPSVESDPIDYSKTHRGKVAKRRLKEQAPATFEKLRLKRLALSNQIRIEFSGQFRDVAGNPFREVKLDSSWLSTSVVTCAKRIHADNAFDRMPILADALEQTGCISEDVLLHCRTSETHVRGCWVIDLLIGDQLGVPDSRK